MEFIDLRFPIKGQMIAVDHGYALYSAICRVIPNFHTMKNAGLALVRGKYSGNGLLVLNKLSAVKIRIPINSIPVFLSLASEVLPIDGHKLVLGNPTILQFKPRSALYSHIVTTKNGNDEERFAATIRSQLDALGIQGEFLVGTRKTFKVSGKKIVGYSLLVTGLTAQESIALQENGLGGRRKMGCGVFIGIR